MAVKDTSEHDTSDVEANGLGIAVSLVQNHPGLAAGHSTQWLPSSQAHPLFEADG